MARSVFVVTSEQDWRHAAILDRVDHLCRILAQRIRKRDHTSRSAIHRHIGERAALSEMGARLRFCLR